MAGDGATDVDIGSAFLPSKEADLLLKHFAINKHVKVAISYSNDLDVHQLFTNVSDVADQVSNIF